MIKKFEILPHTADVRIRAFGETIPDLFTNALYGMSYFLKPEIEDEVWLMEKHEVKRSVKIESQDQTSLLIDFLNEALTLGQTNREIYLNAKFKKLTKKNLEGEIIGVKIDSFEKDIKAATYHEAKIEKKNGLYEITIIYDI